MVYRENKMNEIIIEIPEGFIIDEENSSFTCIKFRKIEEKEITCWEELDSISGYYIAPNAIIGSCQKVSTIKENKNIFTTLEQAEASIALAMLSQLMNEVNANWKPDWIDTSDKYVIEPYKNRLDIETRQWGRRFLTFPTATIRDKFLKDHKALIIQALPLL
jgi:hypothetical protein